MKPHFLKILFAFAAMLTASPAFAASNPANIPSFSSIAAIQALGTSSPFYPTVYVQSYATGNIGGGTFVWMPASTATIDHCNIFTATGVATGRWVRQLTGSESGVDVVNCGALGDGTTDDYAAWTYAKALAEAQSNFTYINFAARSFKINTGIVVRTDLTGLNLRGGTLNFGSISNVTNAITFDSVSATPYQKTRSILQNGTIIGPGESVGSSRCLNFSPSSGGVVAFVSIEDIAITTCFTGEYFNTGAFLIAHRHVTVFFNHFGIADNPGCSNCGENISWSDGSAIFNNESYGIAVGNPSAGYNFSTVSVDYNNSATNPQILIIDSKATFSGCHIEANAQRAFEIETNTSNPQVDVIGCDMVQQAASGASPWIHVNGATYLRFYGGIIRANVGTAPVITIEAGGVFDLHSTTVQYTGATLFSGTANTYFPALGASTMAGTFQGSNVVSSNNLFQCNAQPISLTVGGGWTSVGSTAASAWLFTDKTTGGQEFWLISATAATRVSIVGITSFGARWSSGPQIEITAGTDPRLIAYCQLGAQ